MYVFLNNPIIPDLTSHCIEKLSFITSIKKIRGCNQNAPPGVHVVGLSGTVGAPGGSPVIDTAVDPEWEAPTSRGFPCRNPRLPTTSSPGVILPDAAEGRVSLGDLVG